MSLVVGIFWQGRRAYEKRMRTAKRRLRVELKRRIRKGANVIKKEARRRIKREFRGGDKRRSGGRKPGGLSRATTVSVRSRRGSVSAEIGAKWPGGMYGKIFEEGRTVKRRKSKRAKAHTASYSRRPWLYPAVSATTAEVFQITSQSFRVV